MQIIKFLILFPLFSACAHAASDLDLARINRWAISDSGDQELPPNFSIFLEEGQDNELPAGSQYDAIALRENASQLGLSEQIIIVFKGTGPESWSEMRREQTREIEEQYFLLFSNFTSTGYRYALSRFQTLRKATPHLTGNYEAVHSLYFEELTLALKFYEKVSQKLESENPRPAQRSFLDSVKFFLGMGSYQVPKEKVILTGFSTGGAFAQYSALKYGHRAVTFDSPGLAGLTFYPYPTNHILNYTHSESVFGNTLLHYGQNEILPRPEAKSVEGETLRSTDSENILDLFLKQPF